MYQLISTFRSWGWRFFKGIFMNKEKNIVLRHSILLTITAMIWGIAFVAQSKGGAQAGAFTFNAIRNLIGGLVLVPFIIIKDKSSGKKTDQASYKAGNMKNKTSDTSSNKGDRKLLIKAGVMCGMILCAASMVQQYGLNMGTSAGKAGFLTACYILIVPLLGLFVGKRCGINIIFGVALTLAGLYLLCLSESLRFEINDLLILLSAFLFALHIIVIDYFSPKVDGVKMACIQFFTCGILCTPFMLFIERGTDAAKIAEWTKGLMSLDAWIPILYAGALSCGIGYTLQIVGQAGMNPTVASLIMSLESVFSVIAAWIILGQKLSARQIEGCILIFTAIIIAQIPLKIGIVTERTRKV